MIPNSWNNFNRISNFGRSPRWLEWQIISRRFSIVKTPVTPVNLGDIYAREQYY